MPKNETPALHNRLPVPVQLIDRRIYLIRGHKVMLDADLAELYQVPTKAFNQAVQRNKQRFPEDFMFQLTKEEAENLRSQTVTSSWGGRRYRPYAFTEHGVAMLASVLRSKRAIHMSIVIVRAFIRMRELLASHKDLAARMEKLEEQQKEHGSIIGILAEEIDELKRLPEPRPTRRIGFRVREDEP
jgi:phage regulator Rha-like protein